MPDLLRLRYLAPFMHVLLLNQAFYPDVAATAQHMWDLARHLEQRGHRVTALASRNLYGSSRRAGADYERVGSIEIQRVGGTAFGNRGLLARLVDSASFWVAAAARLPQIPAPDVTLALTSPPMIATLALLQKHLRLRPDGRRCPFVYHVMDLYPDALVASGVIRQDGPVDQKLKTLTRRTLEGADAVIALGRDMRERILKRYGPKIRPERLHVVTPWADGGELHPIPRHQNRLAKALRLDDTFNILYAGSLGIAHDLPTILAAIKATAAHARIRWIFVGGGNRLEHLRQHVNERGWSHVRLLPYRDRQSLNELLNLSDVHLVSQLQSFTGVVVPSKLFGGMAVGSPTLMVAPPEAECSRIVTEHACGFIVGNGDAAALVTHIRLLAADPQLRDAMGGRARNALLGRYAKQKACEDVERILRSVHQPAPARPTFSHARTTRQDAPAERNLKLRRVGPDSSTHVIAILTCHNRKVKTLGCLSSLYSQEQLPAVELRAIVVDDGSTDGTSEAIRTTYPQTLLLPGSGRLYWNGGMRKAMAAAMEQRPDFIWWLNDDVVLQRDALRRLLATAGRRRDALIVGSMQDPDTGGPTYGGWRRDRRGWRTKLELLPPAEEPVECDAVNGNCVLVPRVAYRRLGNLHAAYRHGIGDFDYAFRARKAGIVSVVAPGYFGTCSRNTIRGTWQDPNLPVGERWRRLLSPKGLPPRAWLAYTRQHSGMAWPLYWLAPYVRVVLAAIPNFRRDISKPV